MFNQFLRILQHIEAVLDRIQQKMETLMATLQNFKDLVAALNTETDKIAAKIQAFIDAQTAGGMSAAQEAEALADLGTVVTRLQTLGANPTDPIPIEPPVV